MKTTELVRSTLSTSVRRALSAAALGTAAVAAVAALGCSSDSLKRTFGPSGPTSTGAASPLATAESADATPKLVAGVGYPEASAAATTPAPLETTRYRGADGTAIAPGVAPSSASNSLSSFAAPASIAPSVPIAPSSEFAARADFQEETRLREELIAARADAKRQIEANESLLRQSATYRRDAEEAVAELRRENAELSERNRVLLAGASELQAERAQNERRLQIQNAAFRQAPTTVVVPNNSASTLELKLSDPSILPIRRDGDVATIELQDDLLFESDATRLSAAGERRLQILAAEILSRYPTNVLSIQGHADADPAQADDPLNVQAASVQKAYLVAEFLVEETGVARNQTIVGGCGAVRPIVSNETEANRRRNRRVEIAILPETVAPRFDAEKTVSFQTADR